MGKSIEMIKFFIICDRERVYPPLIKITAVLTFLVEKSTMNNFCGMHVF